MTYATSVCAIAPWAVPEAIAVTPSLPSRSNSSLIDLQPEASANRCNPSHPVGVTVTWWTFLSSPNLGEEPGSKLARLLGWVPRLVDMVFMISFSIPIIPHSLEKLIQIMMDISDTQRHKKTPIDAGATNQKFLQVQS